MAGTYRRMLRGLITYSLVTSLAHHVLSTGTSAPSVSTSVASTLEGAATTSYPASSAAITFSANDPDSSATTSLDPALTEDTTFLVSSSSEQGTTTSPTSTTEEYVTTLQHCEVPGNVAGLNVTALSNSFKVEWTSLSDSSCIEYYIVCWGDDECGNTTENELMIGNLTACTQYNISVSVFGIAGNSSSETRQESTLDEVPDDISEIHPIGRSVTSLQFSWDEPSENPACVVDYTVCWYDLSSESQENCASANVTNHTILSLQPCSTYNITVRADGRNGSTSALVYKLLETDDAVPGSIANIKNTDSSTSSIQLTWDEPSENPTCVVSYEICWQDVSNEGMENCSHSAATNYTIHSLHPCSTYNISVKADGRNSSSPTIHEILHTQDAVPENITNITPIDSSTSSLQLTWAKPSANPTCVVNYSVCWHDVTNEGMGNCSHSEATNYTIHSLDPCSTYNISIKAEGKIGSSAAVYELLRTDDAVPGSVLNLHVQPNHTSLEAVWSKPFVNTACTKRYKICWQTVAVHYRSSGNGYSCTVTEDEQLYIDNLLPCTEYELVVAAVGPSQSSGNETVHLKTLSLVPGSIANITMIDGDTSWLQFTWVEPVENPTCVHNYTVCWQDATSAGARQCSHSVVTSYTVHGLRPCSTYSVAVAAEGSAGSSSPVVQLSQTHEAAPGPPQNLSCAQVGVHNATVQWTASAENSQCVQRYNLSWEGNSSWTTGTSYTITDLQPESRYNVSLAAVTMGDLASTWIYIVIETASEPQNSSVVVAATVISLLLFAGITVCTIYMYRKGILIWPPWEKSALGRKSLTHREIPIKEFRSYCDQLLSTPARLQSEYQLLVTLSADVSATMTTTAGHLPDNKKKNRYVNVIPYDATRVKLETNNKGMSDYINASFIKGYGGGVEYIATQGPKEETCEDFWNMVLQQNVQLILMLTQFEENDKVKCFRYFPGLRGNVKFGDITVHCATEMMFPIYTQRTFAIYKDGRKKTVKHLHFREWPDFGCPDSTDVMLEFVQVGRQNTESRDYPTVVHCSAGVGRTGTYIAVDILLQHIRENKKVDIFNTVYKLRQHRVNMVQSEAQYTYIYQCIKDALDDDSILNAEKSSSSHSLEPIYENISLALNNPSYEKLAKESKKMKKRGRNSTHI